MNALKPNAACRAPGRAQRGFTMLEVLVALLILLIGLLGLAGLLVTTQQGEVEAYQRKQAAVLVQDMIDRLTANPKAAGTSGQCYAFTTSGFATTANSATGDRFLGEASTLGTPACTTPTPAPPAPQYPTNGQRTTGAADLLAWHNALLGTSEKKGTTNVGGLIEARGCVTSPASGVYVVSVAWRGLSLTVAPRDTAVDVDGDGTTDFFVACARNQYNDVAGDTDRRRRVMSITVRLADLT